jgi:hypothetical protein
MQADRLHRSTIGAGEIIAHDPLTTWITISAITHPIGICQAEPPRSTGCVMVRIGTGVSNPRNTFDAVSGLSMHSDHI